MYLFFQIYNKYTLQFNIRRIYQYFLNYHKVKYIPIIF